MAEPTTDPQAAIAAAGALNMQHPVLVVDRTLKLKVTGFSAMLTLGFETPSGVVIPSATLSMPLDYLQQLASAINAALKESKERIAKDHLSLQKKL